MFLKKIRHEFFKPLVFINQINRTAVLLQDRSYSFDLDALFVGVFCLQFIPGLLLNSILHTTKPRLSDLVYLFIGVIISRQFKLPVIDILSRALTAYSKASDLVELMNSDYSMYNIVLYNIFHTLTRKFVEKVLIPTEQSILSISDYIKLSTAFFIIYAGRDFNIPSYLILSVSGVIFLSLEFPTSFNLFYIKFNKNNTVPVLNTESKNINKKANSSNVSVNKEKLTSNIKVTSSYIRNNSLDDNVDTSVVKRGRGRPAKKETMSFNDTKEDQMMDSEDKEGKKKAVKRKGRKKKNVDFL